VKKKKILASIARAQHCPLQQCPWPALPVACNARCRQCPWSALAVARIARGQNCPWSAMPVASNVRGQHFSWPALPVVSNARGQNCPWPEYLAAGIARGQNFPWPALPVARMSTRRKFCPFCVKIENSFHFDRQMARAARSDGENRIFFFPRQPPPHPPVGGAARGAGGLRFVSGGPQGTTYRTDSLTHRLAAL